MQSSFSMLISHPHQTLEKHLSEVDRISRLALASKYVASFCADNLQLERWRQLLVYFHDFGKSTFYFQHKIIKAVFAENPSFKGLSEEYILGFYQKHGEHNIELDLEQDNRLGSHAALGAYAVQQELDMESLLMRTIILEIIKRHHGDLHNFDIDEFSLIGSGDDERLPKQWTRADKTDYALILSNQGMQLPQALDGVLKRMDGKRLILDLELEGILPAVDIRPYVLTLFLFSLLLAADKGDLMIRDREGIGRVFLFPQQLIAHYKSAMFGGLKPKPIDVQREKAYFLVQQNMMYHPDNPFYSITLPTGMGKTFTAFNAAIQLQNILASRYREQGGETVPRIVYCLPFTSVIDQNSAILEDILKQSQIPDGYLAKHHYLADWPEKKSEIENEMSDSEKEYFTEGWEYPFTVTTFVQLLETLFSNKNRKLRKFHNIANAIIILDEVQNIPPKYFETVEAMFHMLYKCFNTRFMFVTATQPFLVANEKVLELTDPEKIETKRFFEHMNRIDMDVSLWKAGVKPLDELLKIFKHSIIEEKNKSFLFIFSKVKASQEAYIEIKKAFPEAEMVYLSAAVLPVLRKERIEQIKKSAVGKQLIVVSTQVVEAGVDIDLDIVYRDFAPLDSINQSAGRCNRNGQKGRGEVRLFKSEDGAKMVYDSVLLNITEHVIHQYLQTKESSFIPESDFFILNETYARQIRTTIADNNDHSEMIEWMKALQFEKVSHKFQLIDQQKFRHGVFINYCDKSDAVWKEYTATKRIKDRWDRKKELRKIRPKLLQYVVQFPEKNLPKEKITPDTPLILLDQEEYSIYYSLETGYGKFEETQGITPNYSVNC